MEVTKRCFLQILQAQLAVSFFLLLLPACRSGCDVKLISVKEPSSTGNVLMKKIQVVSHEKADLLVRYWETRNSQQVFVTPVSIAKEDHSFSLLFLNPASTYAYEVVARHKECENTVVGSGTFDTKEIPAGMQEMIMPAEMQPSLPDKFQHGYVLTARRDPPGQLYLTDAKGNLAWYHTIGDAGFKVAHYTNNNTILAIVAPLSYPTSYGDQILEISLAGDTVFQLKKGEKGLDKTIHHDVFYNASQQLVTITLEKKVYDLRSVSGTLSDTVTGDGILVLDKKGNKVWSWSVFDVVDPLSDPHIVRDKADWLHANSLSLDTDGNYLLSFYLSGQIWKIDAKNGKLIWKMGRDADFTFSPGGPFTESHAVHRTSKNQLMLFENGVAKRQSSVLVYTLDEADRKAHVDLSLPLPINLYSERMGSAYFVGDSSMLVCSSQANSVSLAGKNGEILWRIRTGFIPYRAEFIDSLPLQQ
ncbi:aryl-sulfate sulfotransferase [Paraflavitalea sp. CAU 1676]|uniref:aryl-sulfate sulfotransferase n=1 Tax=Paraflavitalea sp. CAU 1676 TaxID=3032598 RepID=UPI0023DC3CA6|nr:aryl-sulfate sulfotransferase [Paraflavitalea sp. CAU 1676]MDF2190324.1 aryl-sulfate sulfotransferase [Paraflavitalea sp. CAU 1676]